MLMRNKLSSMHAPIQAAPDGEWASIPHPHHTERQDVTHTHTHTRTSTHKRAHTQGLTRRQQAWCGEVLAVELYYD